jgi:tetratricopeptide (TPR) repeat protein
MLQLLENAASQAREAGRRLLLVIDGLDEDSGTATGPSIAALLPRRPPPEVRVLVASRPHPPIPDDVTDDHPLRTISPRQLDVSEHARDVERRAKHELTQLLAGEQLQRDVLGLMTAAGGGLTLADLEQLTERPPYEIRRLLGGVFGRSIGNRISRPSAGYPDERVYLFTHETLRLVAEQQYGASLAAYRDRLHTWADSYKQRCWPADTPRYLLRSYPRMLTSSEDLPRLVACATDQTRHDRMRDLTGGDALAFTEISTAQQLILAQPDPDLTSLALLAVQREHLTDRNSSIPDNLPVVWVMLGQPTRAEALANSIPDPSRRTLALEQLAKVLAAAGDHGRAESLATQITYPYQLANALAGIARAADHFDDLDRAARLAAEIEALVGLLTHPFEQAGASQELARLTAAAEDLAVQITDVGLRGQVLIRLAEVLARGGDHSHAARLATEVETLAAQKIDPVVRERAWACLVEALAISGDLERAEAITGRLTDPLQRTGALQALVEATAASGDLDKTQALIAQLIPGQRGWPLPALIKAAVTVGDLDRAEALIELIELDTDPFQQLRAFLPLLRAAGGHRDRATRLATQAEILAGQITDPYVRVHALAGLAGTAGASGDDDRAARLASEGEDLTEKISDPYLRLQVLVGLIGAGGDGAARLAARAEALAAQISDPDWKTQALIRLAEIVAAGGDYDRATRLAAEAEALSMQITNPWLRMVVLTELMGMVGPR